MPLATGASVHIRLPLRKAGDYPTAIVSLSVTRDAADRVTQARLAIGAVEQVARRWTRLEAALVGAPLDAGAAHRLATGLVDDFTGRDGVEAPGWYRVGVLPALIRRAVAALH